MTTEDRAVAAGHSVDPGRWQEAFEVLMSRMAGRFARVEPRRRVRDLVLGLLSDLPRKRPHRVRADKAYASRANWAYLRRRGIKATIPVPADRVRNRQKLGSRSGRPPGFDKTDYKPRHAVERGITRLKRPRAVATRYNKLAVRYEATVLTAVLNEWL